MVLVQSSSLPLSAAYCPALYWPSCSPIPVGLPRGEPYVGYDESDYQRELEEQALEEMFREWLPDALWERQAETAAKYLQTFGDAAYERVLRCLGDARSLLAAGHHEAALSRAFTAIELLVGHLLFRPLFMGVLLSEELANRIVQEMINGKGEKGVKS